MNLRGLQISVLVMAALTILVSFAASGDMPPIGLVMLYLLMVLVTLFGGVLALVLGRKRTAAHADHPERNWLQFGLRLFVALAITIGIVLALILLVTSQSM